jgi:hypothetical protein
MGGVMKKAMIHLNFFFILVLFHFTVLYSAGRVGKIKIVSLTMIEKNSDTTYFEMPLEILRLLAQNKNSNITTTMKGGKEIAYSFEEIYTSLQKHSSPTVIEKSDIHPDAPILKIHVKEIDILSPGELEDKIYIEMIDDSDSTSFNIPLKKLKVIFSFFGLFTDFDENAFLNDLFIGNKDAKISVSDIIASVKEQYDGKAFIYPIYKTIEKNEKIIIYYK